MRVALTGDSEDGPAALDAELVNRFINGDEAAFAQLYRRYRPLVEAVCRRHVASADVADAVQETFIRFLKALPRLAGTQRVPGYLAAVARSACIDALRASGPAVETDAGEELLDVADSSTPVDVEYEQRWLTATVLANLRPVDAALLREHHADGVPLADLAKRLGSTPGSIAVRLHRARNRAEAYARSSHLQSLIPVHLVGGAVWRRLRRWLQPANLSPAGVVGPLVAAAVLGVVVAPPGQGRPEQGPNQHDEPVQVVDSLAIPVQQGDRLGDGGAAGRLLTDLLNADDGNTVRPQSRSRAQGDTDRERLPSLRVPVAGTRIEERKPAGSPDFTYGARVAAPAGGDADVHAKVEVYDEPETQEVHEASCVVTDAAAPATYCERGSD